MHLAKHAETSMPSIRLPEYYVARDADNLLPAKQTLHIQQEYSYGLGRGRGGAGGAQRGGSLVVIVYLKSFLTQVGEQGVGVGLAGSRHQLVFPSRLQKALHVQVEASLPTRPLWLVALRDNLCAPTLACLCAGIRELIAQVICMT